MAKEDTRVLVAEDNAALAGVLRFNLEQAGFQVTVVRNGALAWETAQQTHFALILTDQQMPLMTGIEFCTRLRELEAYDGVPIILLTAKGLELELPKLREEVGISATFSKPFSPSEVLRAVQDLVSSTRTSDCETTTTNG